MAKKSTVDWILGDLLISEKIPEKEIAARLNCNIRTVQNRKRKLGANQKYDWNKGHTMLKQGFPARHVARAMGCSVSTVIAQRKKIGVAAYVPPWKTVIDWGIADKMIRDGIDHGIIAKKLGCSKEPIRYRALRMMSSEDVVQGYPYFQELKKRLELVRGIVGLNEDMFNEAVKYPNCWGKIFIPKLNQSKEGRRIIVDLFGDWNDRKVVGE